MVQSIINNTPSRRLGDRAPVTVFTGQAPNHPLRTIVPGAGSEPVTIDEVRLLQVLSAEALQDTLDTLHKEVQDISGSQRLANRARHNNSPHLQVANFHMGEFVLVAKRSFAFGDKLTVRWRGPQRVVKILSEYVSAVEDLRTGAISDVHNTRLRFYADSMLGITEDLLTQIAYNEQGYPVRGFRDLRYDQATKQFLVLVSWQGFESDDDTYKPLVTMHEDVLDKLNGYLARHPDQDLVSRARSSLA